MALWSQYDWSFLGSAYVLNLDSTLTGRPRLNKRDFRVMDFWHNDIYQSWKKATRMGNTKVHRVYVNFSEYNTLFICLKHSLLLT